MRSIDHAEGVGADQRAEVLEAYALAANLAGVPGEGLDVRRAALVERERLGQWQRVGENLRWISRLAWMTGRGREARAIAVQAVEVLQQAEPGGELAMAMSNRSQLHMLADELAEAVEWGERARALAQRLGDPETVIHASINVQAAHLSGGDLAAADALNRIHAAASAAGMFDHAARALGVCAGALVDWGEYLLGAAAFYDAQRYVTAHDLDFYRQYLLGVRALIRLEQCDWDGALDAARESLDGPGRGGVQIVSALVARGRILAARGADDAMSTLDRAADEAGRTGEPQWIAPVAAARAEYFLLDGQRDRAAEEVRAALALPHVRQAYAGELAYWLWQAEGGADVPGVEATPFGALMAGDWAAAATQWARSGRAYTRVEALSAGDRTAVAEALRILDKLDATRVAQRLLREVV